MLPFPGHNPIHLKVNPVVKAYIIAESFLWSAWNFTIPIFAVFIVTTVPKGNVELAATGYSLCIIVRVVFELMSGKFLARSKDMKKVYTTVFGMCIMSIAYVGFAFSSTILGIFLLYGVLGMGLGIATPAKNALFSRHLDRDKESTEWSLADATQFIFVAIAIALGGFIAGKFGFSVLFLIAGIVNAIGVIPYLLYV